MLFKPADGGPRRTHGGAELEDDEGWKKPAGKSRGRSEQPTDGVARQCTCGQASAGNASGHGRGMAGSKHQRRPVCRAAVTALMRKSAESNKSRFGLQERRIPSPRQPQPGVPPTHPALTHYHTRLRGCSHTGTASSVPRRPTAAPVAGAGGRTLCRRCGGGLADARSEPQIVAHRNSSNMSIIGPVIISKAWQA